MEERGYQHRGWWWQHQAAPAARAAAYLVQRLPDMHRLIKPWNSYAGVALPYAVSGEASSQRQQELIEVGDGAVQPQPQRLQRTHLPCRLHAGVL